MSANTLPTQFFKIIITTIKWPLLPRNIDHINEKVQLLRAAGRVRELLPTLQGARSPFTVQVSSRFKIHLFQAQV